MGCLSVVFNIIWILTGGWMTALAFLLAGVLCYLTIIGIPLGRQAFKMASLTLAPFGKTITYGGGTPSLVANVFWVVLVGAVDGDRLRARGCSLLLHHRRHPVWAAALQDGQARAPSLRRHGVVGREEQAL